MASHKNPYYRFIEGICERYEERQGITRIDRINYYRAKREIALMNACGTLDLIEQEWFREEANLCSHALEIELRDAERRFSRVKLVEEI